jgi:hypothetical protein
MLLDGLAGGRSDICGNVTPASLSSHVDQTLGPWEQRPIYKANVQTFVTLRKVAPKVPPEVLRHLPTYFPDRASVYALDPSFEEDRRNAPEGDHISVDPDHVRIFKELQRCNRHGLVVPVDAENRRRSSGAATSWPLRPTSIARYSGLNRSITISVRKRRLSTNSSATQAVCGSRPKMPGYWGTTRPADCGRSSPALEMFRTYSEARAGRCVVRRPSWRSRQRWTASTGRFRATRTAAC